MLHCLPPATCHPLSPPFPALTNTSIMQSCAHMLNSWNVCWDLFSGCLRRGHHHKPSKPLSVWLYIQKCFRLWLLVNHSGRTSSYGNQLVNKIKNDMCGSFHITYVIDMPMQICHCFDLIRYSNIRKRIGTTGGEKKNITGILFLFKFSFRVLSCKTVKFCEWSQCK